MRLFKYIATFTLLLTSSVIFATSDSDSDSDSDSLKTLDKSSTQSQQQIKKEISPKISKTKEFEKLFKSSTDYLYVFSAETAVVKYVGNNKYTLSVKHPYPHVIYFSNQKNPQVGTLFTNAFIRRLMKIVKNNNYKTQFRMRLYPGESWNNQLAQPMQVELQYIERKDNKTWVFHITPIENGSISTGVYIYPDFYIFNSDLPKPVY